MVFGEHGRAGPVGEARARARDDLPGVRFLHVQNVRDVAVGVVERLSEYVRSSLGGRESAEQNECAERQRLRSFGTRGLVRAWIGRLGRPRRHHGLAAGPRRLPQVDREPDGRRREECHGIAHGAPIRRLPAYPDFLHDILGGCAAAEYSASGPEDSGARAQERRKTVVMRHRHGFDDGKTRTRRLPRFCARFRDSERPGVSDGSRTCDPSRWATVSKPVRPTNGRGAC